MITKTTFSKCNLFRLSKTPIYFLLFYLSVSALSAQTRTTPGVPETFTITNPATLNATYSSNLIPGDVVVLADGTYSASATMKFNAVGTTANPITFRSATPGGVKFTNGQQLKIGGEYCIIDGFYWQGGYGANNFIEFRDSSDYANHSTIQNCAIDGLGVEASVLAAALAGESIPKHRWIVLYGTYNTVINCTFMNKVTAGALVLVELEYNASPDGGATNNRCLEVGHTIMNNYFYNFEKMEDLYGRKANGDELSNAGDSETMRVGTSEFQNVNTNAIVSNNYFVKADGENEIITNKSKGNSYINNTFRRCRGSLVLRHGSHATVDGNYFLGENTEGTGGIRIVDSYQTITNNYIQDCITTSNNAIWNNGITFLGGNDSNAVVCSSTSVSNGYQKVQNLNLSNNTIVNTNAPLFFNINTGTTKPTGTVSNNLTYFATSNPNLTAVITGNGSSPIQLGLSLTYSGNEYKGTTIGETTYTGFSENTGITATAAGEIFTFSGTNGKGADMGAYTPTTDAMVGHEIGACFLNNLGVKITDGNCTIIIPESLIVSSLPMLTNVAGSYDVSVTANVGWSAVSNDAWITTVNPTSGSGDATVSITVTENPDTNSRVGTITFTQDAGGDDIVKTLTVNQEGISITDLYNLINDAPGGGPVSIVSYSKQQDTDGKTNYASNTLDQLDSTVWAADDLDPILPGDYKGDGEFIIYNLGDEYELDLIQVSTDGKSDSYGIQIWVSTTGTDPSDFTMVLPTTGDLLLTATGTRDFNQYEISTTARFVKLIGFGRFNSAGDTNKSVWTNISRIEFYGDSSSLSVNENNINNIKIYPNPIKDIVTLKNIRNNVSMVQVFTIDGRKVMEKSVKSSEQEITLDMAPFANGAYILNISNGGQSTQSKMIIVSH